MTGLATGAPRRSEEAEARDRQSRTKAMRAILISSGGLTLPSLLELFIGLATYRLPALVP